MIEHHIQKEIIKRLAKAPTQRFSELKSEGLESNAFMYHLNQLISQKYVLKTPDGYTLSTLGLTYVDNYSFQTRKPRKQSKVISIIALVDNKGRWLLARRKYQPYIGQLMFLSGKQHFGESPEDHVIRELNEKVGLRTELQRRGLADIRIYKDKSLLTHVTAHIYQGKAPEGFAPEATEQFDFVWSDVENETNSLMAGTKELHNHLKNKKDLFFLSLDVKDNKSYT